MSSLRDLSVLTILTLAAAVSYVLDMRDDNQLQIEHCSYEDLEDMSDLHFKENFCLSAVSLIRSMPHSSFLKSSGLRSKMQRTVAQHC